MRIALTAALILVTAPVGAMEFPYVDQHLACSVYVGSGSEPIALRVFRLEGPPGAQATHEAQMTLCLRGVERDRDRLKEIWGRVSDKAQRECWADVPRGNYAYSFAHSCIERIVSERLKFERQFNERAEACEENRRRHIPCDR